MPVNYKEREKERERERGRERGRERERERERERGGGCRVRQTDRKTYMKSKQGC